MESFAEILCPLPDTVRNRKRRSTGPLSPKAYLISITTNGNSFSNQIPVIIFDSACSECEIIGTSMKCNPKVMLYAIILYNSSILMLNLKLCALLSKFSLFATKNVIDLERIHHSPFTNVIISNK